MKTAKDFLAQECVNLAVVLAETLRLKYGLEGSKEFFDECSARLAFLSGEVSKTKESDYDGLKNISFLLIQLTDLISRIERSSIGEYSWPFVEQLKRIAIAVCTEPTLTNPKTPPQIYVLAGGGLDAYAIHPEQNRPSGSNKRIHTIVFPRTLKHFVLLHAILGHETGHAMWRCSQHQSALKTILDQHLFKSGHFSNPAATAAWLYSGSAPLRIKQTLAQLATQGVTESNFFSAAASWPAWTEEILCDFIGLLTFGPSFVAAECHLLYAMDPAGAGLGPKHPPVGCRANYLLSGAELRGYTSDDFSEASTKSSVTAFWSLLKAKRQTDAWFDVFTSQQIQETADALAGLLGPLPPSLYEPPSDGDFSLLVKQLVRIVPPVGFELKSDGSVNCRSIDFRHVLYAGWVVSATPPPKITCAQINQLCEHGIMQQRAVDLQISE
jgi:hypothetical protein